MDLNFCFSPAIELTGSNHMRYRRELIPLFITASLAYSRNNVMPTVPPSWQRSGSIPQPTGPASTRIDPDAPRPESYIAASH